MKSFQKELIDLQNNFPNVKLFFDPAEIIENVATKWEGSKLRPPSPLNPFILFRRNIIEILKSKNITLKTSEIRKVAISNWANLPAEEKFFWQELTDIIKNETISFKFSKKIIEQIKNFEHWNLTSKQELLINRLMLDIGLIIRYKKYGLCQKCNWLNTVSKYGWCQFCSSSTDLTINKFVQEHQSKVVVDQEEYLEWIPYKQFTNVKYLAQGGFGNVFKAECKGISVALKSLKNSQNAIIKFLQEVAYHRLAEGKDINVVKCYGISQDPDTKNYIMVMEYIPDGDLRQFLDNNRGELQLRARLKQLKSLADGLSFIHQQGLIHQDLHSGNILNKCRKFGKVIFGAECYITDLGLCRPVDEFNDKKVYGVLPYVAPEVLRGQPYTQAADIYSFGIVAYEILSGSFPYPGLAYDEFLALKICQGLRPRFQIKIPQLLKDLIDRCWDTNVLSRPTTNELKKTLSYWLNEIDQRKNTEFVQQYKEKGWFLNNSASLDYKLHPQAFYASRLLNYENLSEPQNSREINEQFYKIVDDLEYLRITDSVKFSEELERKVNGLQIQEEKNLATKTKRQLSLESQTKTNQGETKLTKISENQEYYLEPMEMDRDWRNIHLDFTSELQKQWEILNFTYNQTQDWINIGLTPADHNLAKYLKEKNLTPEEVLNNYNLADLKTEFQEFQQTPQIIHNPPKTN